MKKLILIPIYLLFILVYGCTSESAGTAITSPTLVRVYSPAPVSSPASTTTPSPIFSPSPQAASTSGIEGHILQGPMCPGPVGGNSTCPDQPYQARISILDSHNQIAIQFQSDVDGYFKLPLPPGTYTLYPESSSRYPHAADQIVVVSTGQFTQVTINFDTGIR